MSGNRDENSEKSGSKTLGLKIIITPETHWDREWYLPFQEYRAKLVLMMDQLLYILRTDPNYANFTLDGQTIPLEDYLEVQPSKEEELKKYIKEGRLSIGPMYILPDEFLVSGESMIRNLMLGHKISIKYGKPMNAGYIPDPFGHFAQMPQILSGFEIPSILFARGFGDEFEKLGLNMEFIWEAPGNAADVLGIHLIQGYGSVANLDIVKSPSTGLYENALNKIKWVSITLAKQSISKVIILNNGSDHLFAQPHIPELVKQWNNLYGETIGTMEQADFEKYTKLILDSIDKSKLKKYRGELHGGKYNAILPGVFSSRIWIKQWNKLIENRLERYTEPFSTITWMYDTAHTFDYPRDYIWTGWKWLLKNHPHDSICGCSIDPVHEDMKTRFGWAEQISFEVFKNSAIHLSNLINFDMELGERFPIFVYNPTPRKQNAMVKVPLLINAESLKIFPIDEFTVIDYHGNQVYHFTIEDEVEPRYTQVGDQCYSLNFMGIDLPAFGIKTYYIIPGQKQKITINEIPDSVVNGKEDGRNFIENKYYKILKNKNGTFDIFDKECNIWFKDQGILEDMGDWGDEYDFSGPEPKKEQFDLRILSTDKRFIYDYEEEMEAEKEESEEEEFDKYKDKLENVENHRNNIIESEIINFGNTAFLYIYLDLLLPESLQEDRKTRSDEFVHNPSEIIVSLNSSEKKIFIDIINDNRSMNHRLRILFSSGLKTETISADGHFYVVPRPVDIPIVNNWIQDPVPTNFQNKFVSISDEEHCFSVFNSGLPEYEAIRHENDPDGSLDLAITLVRSVGWLSRGDFKTRLGNAGPDVKTPGGQCIGINEFSLGITTGKGNWLSSNVHIKADEFNNPPQVINPISLNMPMRMCDTIVIRKAGVIDKGDLIEKGSLEPEFSACQLSNNKIMVSAFKKAENKEDSLILRVVNMADTRESCTIQFGIPIISADIVNLKEEKPSEKYKIKANIDALTQKSINFTIDPHVITTFLVKIR